MQALVLNWYRFEIALKHEIPNFKPVILFRSKTIEDSKQDYLEFLNLCKNVKPSDFEFLKDYRHPETTSSHSELKKRHSEQSTSHSERSEESLSQGDASPSVQHNTNESLQVQCDNHQVVPPAYDANKEIFENVANFIKKNKITATHLADYVRENFTERNVIITNSKDNKTKKEKTDSETDRLLNSLEDVHNHIRTVFTVQRLTEGWDVLNLYDIVRLYSGRDTNFKAKKAS